MICYAGDQPSRITVKIIVIIYDGLQWVFIILNIVYFYVFFGFVIFFYLYLCLLSCGFGFTTAEKIFVLVFSTFLDSYYLKQFHFSLFLLFLSLKFY